MCLFRLNTQYTACYPGTITLTLDLGLYFYCCLFIISIIITIIPPTTHVAGTVSSKHEETTVGGLWTTTKHCMCNCPIQINLKSCYPAVEGVPAAKLGLIWTQTVLRYLPIYVFMPSCRENRGWHNKHDKWTTRKKQKLVSIPTQLHSMIPNKV